ncbi:hypothetical protein B7939_07985 [Eggerthia catenaformis]|nr:hypothetical protein B7939_07985 [Eggerthia catenaformis]
MTNTSNKALENISYRIKCKENPDSIHDAFAIADTPYNGLVIRNSEQWNKVWKQKESHSFSFKYEELIQEDIKNFISSIQSIENYSGYEADEVQTPKEAENSLTLDDFDVRDGIDTLGSEERPIYEKLLRKEKEKTKKVPKTPRRIRWKARDYVINNPEYTLRLDHPNNPCIYLKKDEYWKKSVRKSPVIQAYHVGSKYIYVTNLKKIGNIYNIYIHRLIKNKADTEATYESSMRIIGGGHGQTLELFDHKGKTYFLVDLNTTGNKAKWGTQLGRVEYQPGKTIQRENIPRLTYLCDSKNGYDDFGKILRADGALSTDRNYLLIWKRREKNQNNPTTAVECTIHDFKAVNNELDTRLSKGYKTATFHHNTKIKSIQSFSSKKGDYTLSGSQGIELSNKQSNGLFSIYWTLGDEDKQNSAAYWNKAEHFLGIKRYESDGRFCTDRHIKQLFYNDKMEMEAPSLPKSGNFIRILLVETDNILQHGPVHTKTVQYICRIDRNALIKD